MKDFATTNTDALAQAQVAEATRQVEASDKHRQMCKERDELKADVKPLIDALIHICAKPELRPRGWLMEAIEDFKTKHPDCHSK